MRRRPHCRGAPTSLRRSRSRHPRATPLSTTISWPSCFCFLLCVAATCLVHVTHAQLVEHFFDELGLVLAEIVFGLGGEHFDHADDRCRFHRILLPLAASRIGGSAEKHQGLGGQTD